METVLSSWCGGRDIVTPFASDAEERARAQLGGRPMNYRRGWLGPRYRSHQSASEVRQLLPDLWASAFKFAVERHPYERAVSLTYWRIFRHKLDPVADFEQELTRVLEGVQRLDNRRYYCIDGRIAVDEVVRFDRLWSRCAEIAASLGVDMPDEVPRAKGTQRLDQRAATEILTESQKERIYQLTRADFEEFGFTR